MAPSLCTFLRTLVHRHGNAKDQEGANKQEKGGHDKETVAVVLSATSPAGKDTAQVSTANINVSRSTPPPQPTSPQQTYGATAYLPTLPAAPATDSADLETSADADGTAISLSVRLWDRAYNGLKREEKELVDAYEKILSRQLQDGLDSEVPESQLNIIAQNDSDARRRQMAELIRIGLKKTAGEAKWKESVGKAVDFVMKAKDIISSAIQAVPQAAFAWTGVLIVLEVSLPRKTMLRILTFVAAYQSHNRDQSQPRRDRVRCE